MTKAYMTIFFIILIFISIFMLTKSNMKNKKPKINILGFLLNTDYKLLFTIVNYRYFIIQANRFFITVIFSTMKLQAKR